MGQNDWTGCDGDLPKRQKNENADPKLKFFYLLCNKQRNIVITYLFAMMNFRIIS